MSTMIEITGQKFGRLTAVRFVGNKNGKARWLFRCDCGNLVEKDAASVQSGNTSSCGCLHREQLIARNKATAKHGCSKDRLYGVWHGMKERCLSKTHKDYSRYGARGITVCSEWADSFEAFKAWAMSNGYNPDADYGKCTLDRIDNSKGYGPDNCRWVDSRIQAKNRRHGYEIYNLKGHRKKSRESLHVCG